MIIGKTFNVPESVYKIKSSCFIFQYHCLKKSEKKHEEIQIAVKVVLSVARHQV